MAYLHVYIKLNWYTFERGKSALSVFFPSHWDSTLKGKNLLLRSKFFPFGVDLILDWCLV